MTEREWRKREITEARQRGIADGKFTEEEAKDRLEVVCLAPAYREIIIRIKQFTSDCFDEDIVEPLRFLESHRTMDAAWQACERGKWMLFVLGKTITCKPWTDGRKPLLACALDCAETVKVSRSRGIRNEVLSAVGTLRRWIAGTVSVEEAQVARRSLSLPAYDAFYLHCAGAAAAASDASVADDAAGGANSQNECVRIIRSYYPSAPALEASQT